MAFLRVAARGFGSFMDQGRIEVVARLQRRLGEQRRLLSNGTNGTTGTDYMRKALLEDRFRMDMDRDRKVLRDSWEQLAFVRGKPLIEQQTLFKRALIWLAPNSASEMVLSLLRITVISAVLLESSKQEVAAGWENWKEEMKKKLFLAPALPKET